MTSANKDHSRRRRVAEDGHASHAMETEAQVSTDVQSKEIDILLKQYDLVWSNIHHNETVRDRLFNFYLVAFSFLMLGSFQLLGIHATTLKDIPRSAISIPFLVIAFVGVVTVAMQARLRVILNRDIKTSDDIRAYFCSKYPEANRAFSPLQRYFAGRKRSWFHQVFSLSHLIIYVASVTSAFAGGFGVYLGLQNATVGSVTFVALLLVSFFVARAFEARWLYKGSG